MHTCGYRRPYGAGNLLVDLFMVIVTGGLWLIRVFVREMRGGHGYSIIGFLADLLLSALTGGLWLIWVFIREMQRR